MFLLLGTEWLNDRPQWPKGLASTGDRGVYCGSMTKQVKGAAATGTGEFASGHWPFNWFY